ncbi:MAG: hypothetical protein BMS9Abin04_065 [Planctomycetia bacterium]|nr:MAG: hypothetical protein BMS9Abin04_065 [Planctomycetia bacterium]
MTTASLTDCEVTRQFTLWAFDQLELHAAETGGLYRLTLPDGPWDSYKPGDRIVFRFEPEDDSSGSEPGSPAERPQVVTPASDLFEWLLGQLRAQGDRDRSGAVHARPRQQPANVHEISDRLFSAYQVDGGTVHLAGCCLEDRPLLRLTYRSADGGSLWHRFLDENGRQIDAELVARLHLNDLVPTETRDLPGQPHPDIRHLLAVAARHEEPAAGGTSGRPAAERVARTLVWCRFAQGKLQFTLGPATAEQTFSGWAETLEAPPFVCPQTGTAGYHLAATDDGLVTLAEAVATCDQSGRRVLARDLVRCGVTGQRVLASYTEICPVTAQPVLAANMATCTSCRQRVSRAVLDRRICRACRHLATVKKDDPRLARLLGDYPKLDHWRSWRLAETATVYITCGAGLLRKLLVVVDKRSFEPLHVARGSRFSGQWTPVAADQYGEELSSSA